MNRRLRIYFDTSVFGGCFDDEFSYESLKILDEVKAGRYKLILSSTSLLELSRAPKQVRDLLKSLPEDSIEIVDISDEIESLRDAYINAGVIEEANIFDAEHIASATIANADLIVSWNYKHIVHFMKIKGYHAVNLMHGYYPIPIHSPSEVIER